MSTTAPTTETAKPKVQKKPRNPEDPAAVPKEKRPPREKQPDDGKPKEPRENRPPRENNNPNFKQKEENKERPPRTGGDRPLFVQKDEANKQAGVDAGDGKKREKKPRVEREKKESQYDWNKDNIKIDTPIPEVPKKAVQQVKPNVDDHHKALDKIDDEIDAIHKQKKKYIDDLYNQKRNTENKEAFNEQPLRETLKAKIEQKKELKKKHEIAKSEASKFKEEIETLFDESNKLRQKMKICKTLAELQTELETLKYRQNNEYLTLTEEKNVIKQIGEIEQSLPHAEPLAQIEAKMETIRKASKEFRKAETDAYAALKKIEEEIKVLQADLDDCKKSRTDNKDSLEPLIQKKKEEYAELIEQLKVKKQGLKDKFRADLDAFDEEQELIRYHEWVKRKVEKLKLNEKFKQRDEERKRREEEESKVVEVNTPNPFEKEIDLCEQLVSYLEKLRPKAVVKTEEVKEVSLPNPEDVKKLLESNEWKQEQVTPIVSKRNREEPVGKKNNKSKAQQATKAEETENQVNEKLRFDVNIERYFDELKVQVPATVTDLDKTIENIKQKKAYFESNPKQNEEAATTVATEAAAEKPKHEKQQKHNAPVINEEDFPSI